ncbi:unnamed protein product (macronuclear) [Paramecium tetraurelia]|uniref:HTH psq-type domain-containing protein n=1 Tax=Paramecium tetraurelia TaxID=5888 RepID=A0C6F5_PARTE|nr:uncharacterized protein GSPATT00035501001 [Paramecium tetraurelia]CAK66372.1 unnamed protein product [Paramecium tetraurelia]|eukprot:XP_001433769.1 hypothetical protein (macronuclear) [Paramecium tetraurelia strain d4-2]
MTQLQKMDSRLVSEFENDIKGSQSAIRNAQCHQIFQGRGKKYMKIKQDTKQQLYCMVQKQGMKIKDAALKLGIKYATAKTIIFHQRQKRKAKRKCGERMCGYTRKYGQRSSRLEIISIIGSEVVHKQDYNL